MDCQLMVSASKETVFPHLTFHTEDGNESEATREGFVEALRGLEGLPVWVVIRLMTDDVKVTKFYNDLDALVDFPLDVLDDLCHEAKEVHKHNRWLTYSLPLHRCRELGLSHPLFDVIDERRLSSYELQCFCGLLFGTPPAEIPSATTDFPRFLKYLQDKLGTQGLQWDANKRKPAPIINVAAIQKMYGKRVFGWK